MHYSYVHAHIVVLQFVAQSGENFGGILVENALLHLADAYFEGIGRDESGLHHSHSADEHTAVRVVADKVVPSRSEHGLIEHRIAVLHRRISHGGLVLGTFETESLFSVKTVHTTAVEALVARSFGLLSLRFGLINGNRLPLSRSMRGSLLRCGLLLRCSRLWCSRLGY